MVFSNPDLVYSTTLDGKYIIKVVRTEPYHGVLTISEGDTELLREEVGLAYNAVFGPDVDDQASWQDRAIRFVDEELPKK